MKKIILFFLIFLFFGQPPLKAEGEISLSLGETLALGLRDNREILLKTEELKKAQLKIKEAKAGLLPSLTFSGSWTDTRGYYNKDISQTTTQTTLRQYLYKGGRTINTIKYAGHNFEVAQAVLDKTKLEILFQIEKSFYTLLLAQEFSQLNKQILENTRAHLGVLEARYQTGEASQSDILKIKESLDSVQEAFIASINQAETSLALLRDLLYLADEVKIIAQGQFSYECKEVAYDEAFLKAMKTRPEIRQYEAQQQAAKSAVEIAKADNRPTIYASWDYYSRSHVLAAKNWNDYNALGLVFSWPIFDGWATQSKVEQAIVDLKESQLNQEKGIKDIALELKQAYLDLKNAVAGIKSNQAQVDFYNDTFTVTEAKYKNGLASSMDLEDAQLGHQVSLFNEKQAIYDYILAKSGFDKATGGL